MSLIVAVSVPTGIVLSGDSRTTGFFPQPVFQASAQQDQADEKSEEIPAKEPERKDLSQPPNNIPVVISDATNKVFLLFKRFGVGVYGDAFVSGLPIAHTIQQFEASQIKTKPATPAALADALLRYFQEIKPLPQVGMTLIGYDKSEQWILGINVPTGEVIRNNHTSEKQIAYTVVWGGDGLVVSRLLSDPKNLPPFAAMNVQDAVDLSRHLIRSTIDQMRFEPRFASVGGPIDTLVVSPSCAEYLAQKCLRVS